MDPIEKLLRDFGAAFAVVPGFRNWVRCRARELQKAGEAFQIVMVWGKRRFRVGRLPGADPYFAIERADGTLERSPWCDASEGGGQCERLMLPTRPARRSASGTRWRKTFSRSLALASSDQAEPRAPSTAPSSTSGFSKPRIRRGARG